ncbi:unnamed protein product [Closterium sp. NIES-65]|nr:unnamed protein product [Closterium sp. NIES-65]
MSAVGSPCHGASPPRPPTLVAAAFSAAPHCARTVGRPSLPGSLFLRPRLSAPRHPCLRPSRPIRAPPPAAALDGLGAVYGQTRGRAAARVSAARCHHLSISALCGVPLGMDVTIASVHHEVAQLAASAGIPLDDPVSALAPPHLSSFRPLHPQSARRCASCLRTNVLRRFSPSEVKVGRQLGHGNFGVVYEATVAGPRGQPQRVVVKRKAAGAGADEMQDVELFMNHRLQRTVPGVAAKFLGTMEVQPGNKLQEHQGDSTLDRHLKDRQYPAPLAAMLLGVQGDAGGWSEEQRMWVEWQVAQTVMRQILSNLRALHHAGPPRAPSVPRSPPLPCSLACRRAAPSIFSMHTHAPHSPSGALHRDVKPANLVVHPIHRVVHRDVKPANLVVDEGERHLCLIDLGACVDLRSGRNYVRPSLTPPPSASSCRPPPRRTCRPSPLASLLSPFIWVANSPDRFDVFSAVRPSPAALAGRPAPATSPSLPTASMIDSSFQLPLAMPNLLYFVLPSSPCSQGVVLMQLSLKSLRHEANLEGFNNELKRCDYDLSRWRKKFRPASADMAVLDAHGGAAFDLAKQLLQKRPNHDHAVWPSGGEGEEGGAGGAWGEGEKVQVGEDARGRHKDVGRKKGLGAVEVAAGGAKAGERSDGVRGRGEAGHARGDVRGGKEAAAQGGGAKEGSEVGKGLLVHALKAVVPPPTAHHPQPPPARPHCWRGQGKAGSTGAGTWRQRTCWGRWWPGSPGSLDDDKSRGGGEGDAGMRRGVVGSEAEAGEGKEATGGGGKDERDGEKREVEGRKDGMENEAGRVVGGGAESSGCDSDGSDGNSVLRVARHGHPSPAPPAPTARSSPVTAVVEASEQGSGRKGGGKERKEQERVLQEAVEAAAEERERILRGVVGSEGGRQQEGGRLWSCMQWRQVERQVIAEELLTSVGELGVQLGSLEESLQAGRHVAAEQQQLLTRVSAVRATLAKTRN